MSIMQQKPPRRSPIATFFKEEWQHLEETPMTTLLLVMVPSLLIFCYSPLVPPLAYLLQRWAAPSTSWRDRWASIAIWQKQSVWWGVFLGFCVFCDRAHIWIIPDLIARVQVFWSSILPGQLTLSPVEIHAGLLAKIVLLLPAAPWLAAYYERIDPRAHQRLTRILTAEDLAPARPAPDLKTKPGTSSQTVAAPSESKAPEPAPKPTTRTPTKKAPQQKPLHRKQSAMPTAQQMTIESYLTPKEPTSAPPTPKTPPAAPKLEPKPQWNWDDVRE